MNKHEEKLLNELREIIRQVTNGTLSIERAKEKLFTATWLGPNCLI